MDHYKVIKCIGKGSYGKVYLAKHNGERKMYVIKVLKLRGIPKKERESAFHEVQLMKQLSHPNIVAFKESFFGRGRDQLCIVMTFCDGGDLAARLKTSKRSFSEGQIMHWFVQLAMGVAFMHSKKILHRDIKTQNAFLLGSGRIVLGDLGISKVLEGTLQMANTQIGTPYYMAPELFKNQPYNHKSDVWALGCVLYEMITLRHPFDATSLSALASKIIKGSYVQISSRYSSNLRKLVSSMLQNDASSRPSVSDILRLPFVRKHLDSYLQDIIDRSQSTHQEIADAKKLISVELGPSTHALIEQCEEIGLSDVFQTKLNQDNRHEKDTEDQQSKHDHSSNNNPRNDLQRNNTQRSDTPKSNDPGVRRIKLQKEALEREKERRKAVQLALARLRQQKNSIQAPRPQQKSSRSKVTPGQASGGSQISARRVEQMHGIMAEAREEENKRWAKHRESRSHARHHHQAGVSYRNLSEDSRTSQSTNRSSQVSKVSDRNSSRSRNDTSAKLGRNAHVVENNTEARRKPKQRTDSSSVIVANEDKMRQLSLGTDSGTNMSARERVLAAKAERAARQQREHEEKLRLACQNNIQERESAQWKLRQQYSGVGVALSSGLPIHEHALKAVYAEASPISKLPPQRYPSSSNAISSSVSSTTDTPNVDISHPKMENDLQAETIRTEVHVSWENASDSSHSLMSEQSRRSSVSEIDEDGDEDVREGLLAELEKSTRRCHQLRRSIEDLQKDLGYQQPSNSDAYAVALIPDEAGTAYGQFTVPEDSDLESDGSYSPNSLTGSSSMVNACVSANVGVDEVFGTHSNEAYSETPSGSLARRAAELRERCINSLGDERFNRVYQKYKSDQENGIHDENDSFLTEFPSIASDLLQLVHLELSRS